MAAGSRFVLPYQTVEDATGVPIPGAFLFFYVSGSSTPLSTYSDSLLTIPNPNPVQANAAGTFGNIFLSGAAYKVVLTDSLLNQISTADPVFGTGVSSANTGYTFVTTQILLSAFGPGVVLQGGTIAQTSGRTTFGDGGAAEFYYNSADTTTADNGGTIRVDTQGRRWYAIIPGPYTLYVGDGIGGTTTDLGTQLNAAYAALPATGGRIVINPKIGGGKYNFSVPVVMTTAGKYVMIQGISPGGAQSTEGCCLNYVPTTATSAFTFDYATAAIGPPSPTCGMRDITLVNNDGNTTGGTGSLATAITIGNSNGGDWDATYFNPMIQGFGLVYDNPNNTAVTQTFYNPNFIANTSCMRVTQATVHVFGGQMAANGRIFLQPAGAVQSEMYFHGVTFFDNTHDPVFDYNTSATKATLFLDTCHMENSPSLHAHYIGGAVNPTIVSGLMEDTNSSAAGDWMIKTSNFSVITILGTAFLAQRVYANGIVDATNEVRGTLLGTVYSAGNVPKLVGGAFASEFTQMPLTPYGATPLPWHIRPQVSFDSVPIYANNAAAVAGGVPTGGIYRTGADPDPVCIVH